MVERYSRAPFPMMEMFSRPANKVEVLVLAEKLSIPTPLGVVMGHPGDRPQWPGGGRRFPVVVNARFNVRGEPIVCTPEDTFCCFMGTGIEVLAVDNCLFCKEQQSKRLATCHEDQFELD